MKIDKDVIGVLEVAETSDKGIVLTGQLDRKLYEKVNKVLTAAGFKWQRGAKAHTHPDADPASALESLLSAGEVIDQKKEFDFFPTSGHALDRVMALAQIELGMDVLEPSAGEGHIVNACLDHFAAKVDVVEINPIMAGKLETIGDVRLIYQGDFLETTPEPRYPRVVMNPPFGRQADLDHVIHAAKFLAPGGRLVAVMSSGVRFRTNKKTLDFHAAIAGMHPVWEDLPEGSFKAAGTGVNTCILTLEKV